MRSSLSASFNIVDGAGKNGMSLFAEFGEVPTKYLIHPQR